MFVCVCLCVCVSVCVYTCILVKEQQTYRPVSTCCLIHGNTVFLKFKLLKLITTDNVTSNFQFNKMQGLTPTIKSPFEENDHVSWGKRGLMKYAVKSIKWGYLVSYLTQTD